MFIYVCIQVGNGIQMIMIGAKTRDDTTKYKENMPKMYIKSETLQTYFSKLCYTFELYLQIYNIIRITQV